jgi:alginate O-acetyltransferase complex protein AlgI
MEFLSIRFLVLFSVSFLIYCLVGKRFRNSLLLLASFVFIGWLYPPFLITAVAVALFTFFWAQLLERKPTQLVYVSGIALLVFFWIALHYTGIVADAVHLFAPAVSKESVMHSLVFPLGMSFYTFQAIGYLTDVYWQDEKAERNFPAFLLYMLFFMKFLSGPIERPGHLLHQLKNPEAFNYQNAVLGMKFILLGLMKKLLIANHIAPHLDIMFNTVDDLSG